MEKQSRVNKYKELRESFKDDVSIEQTPIENQPVDNDDFLAFIPKEKKESIDDTLVEPLSYQTLGKEEDVEQAINQARINVGKEQYNTRLDILNKIKQESAQNVDPHSYQPSDLKAGHSVNEEPAKKMSLLDKLAAMSPEEDVEELKKYEQAEVKKDEVEYVKPFVSEEPVVQPRKQSRVKESTVLSKKEVKALKKQEKQRVSEENYNEEDNTTVSKILNGVIIVLILVFVVLCGFILKDLFF